MVVLLLGVLLSLALPTYRHYLLRGQRVEAVRGVMAVVDCLERGRAVSGYYNTSECLLGLDTTYYRFEIEPENDAASLVFRVIATPQAIQSGDFCGALGLDQAGTRSIGGEAADLAKCWGGR